MIEQMITHRIPLQISKTVSSEDGVFFSTCHSAKGLEFKYVFLIGCNDRSWEKSQSAARSYSLPDTLTLTTEENKTESLRRLFYVGMTRAKEGLVISYSRETNDGREKVASLFVSETGITPQHIAVSEKQMIVVLGDMLKEPPKPIVAQIEKSLVENRLKGFAMSPSSLNSYLDCPLRFYYEQVIRIPFAANDSMSFGSAVHYSLQKFFEKMKASNDKFPPLEEMLNDFMLFMNRNRLSFTEKQFENRMNLGLTAANNQGASMSRGRYVVRLPRDRQCGGAEDTAHRLHRPGERPARSLQGSDREGCAEHRHRLGA